MAAERIYLTEPALRQTPACLPLPTNHLLGPSYVLFDYALALHSMIPEGVAEIISVTPKSSSTVSNSYGRFSYSHLPLRFYALGVCRTFPQAQLALPPLLGGSTECCSQPRA
jgi:hypothetical protein